MSYVYFIACGQMDAVKIGFTKAHPSARLANLQTGCPAPLDLLAFIHGSTADERLLHATFDPLHIQGEWFHLAMKLQDFIWYLVDSNLPGEPASRNAFEAGVRDCILAPTASHPRHDENQYVYSADMSLWPGYVQ